MKRGDWDCLGGFRRHGRVLFRGLVMKVRREEGKWVILIIWKDGIFNYWKKYLGR